MPGNDLDHGDEDGNDFVDDFSELWLHRDQCWKGMGKDDKGEENNKEEKQRQRLTKVEGDKGVGRDKRREKQEEQKKKQERDLKQDKKKQNLKSPQ